MILVAMKQNEHLFTVPAKPQNKLPYNYQRPILQEQQSVPRINEPVDSTDFYKLFEFSLFSKYRFVKTLGKGSFGQVIKCQNVQNNSCVAIKVLDTQKSVSSIISEIDTLKYVNSHDQENLFVKYIDNFNANNFHCVVFELLGENLYEYLKKNKFTGMSLDQVFSITIQLGKALIKLGQLNVIHCDIKPENIAFVPNTYGRWQIKVIDFGSSCLIGKTIYRYIQSRFYRAPEVIMELGYGNLIDMWSVGCVIAELIIGSPLFPGNCELEQMWFFQQFLGPAPQNLVMSSPKFNSLYCVNNNYIILKNIEKPVLHMRKSLHDVLRISPCGNMILCRDSDFETNHQNFENLVNFLSSTLEYDPAKRLRPEQYMSHPFITCMYSSNNIPVQSRMSYPFNTPELSRSSLYSAYSMHQPQPQPQPPVNGIFLMNPMITPTPSKQIVGNEHFFNVNRPQMLVNLCPVNYQYATPQHNETIQYNHQVYNNMLDHYNQYNGQCSCRDCCIIGANNYYYHPIDKDKTKILY